MLYCGKMRTTIVGLICGLGLLGAAGTASASVVFTFLEVGADLKMTSSGTLDTSKMVLSGSDGWGGVGIQNFSGTSIMGGTSFGQNNITYSFNAGTDYSAWMNPGMPWSVNDYNWGVDSGSHSFATFARTDNALSSLVPGMSMVTADIISGLWTPDQSWTNLNDTFASLSMALGTYTIADAITNESITFQIGQIGATPLPAAIWLFGTALIGLVGFGKRKTAA